MQVCDGGTIQGGVTSITFTNSSTTVAYTINTPKSTSNGSNMPGWPATAPVIAKASTTVVQLAVSAQSGNTYEYTTTPACPIATNPKIVVS